MSQFNPSPMYQQPAPASGGNGLALAALITACVGLLIPLVGLVAIVLAIIALVKPSAPGQGKGMAIAGLLVGLFALVLNVAVCAGIMLPALGKARQSARQLVSQTRMMQMGIGLHSYASQNKDWFPESADGLDRLVSSGDLPPNALESPNGPSPAGPAYIYLPPGQPLTRIARPDQTIVVYENPLLLRRASNVLFADGHVDLLPFDELNQRLADQGAPAAALPAGSGGR